MTMQGIDVSKWQGAIDWKKVKASGVEFAIIRAGYGKTVDLRFSENYAGATAAGLPVGAYWYSYALSTAEAEAEAAACIRAISGKRFEMPIYFDVEEQNQLVKSADFVSGLVTTFCTALERAGYFAGLYMSRSPLQRKITPEVAKRFAIWAAEYNTRLNYSGAVGMWQKSATGKVNGISGRVDLDECYIDYPSIIKKAGLNGFSKGTTEPGGNYVNSVEAEKPELKRAVYYTIVRGDTLTAIAKRYKTTVSALVKANNIKNPDKIRAGQKIKIP